jgi:hypothetical protein
MRILRVSVLPDSSFLLGMVPRSIPVYYKKGVKNSGARYVPRGIIDMTTSVG